MSEMPGSITVYDPSMAAAAATMFNDFNALWPGGFSGGVPYTEQRVHDWLDATSAVADLIALDSDGVPVGYCGLYPHYRDAHACYVTVLGVVPRAKGQKVGKRLLLRALDLAIERGYTRFDLNTWPGNLNAVPLYKKVGLFWVPETSVSMQNYLPALARSPLGRAWFKRHPDWYGCFERELAQAPDQETHGGMEVYTYRFREGDDVLTARVDRYGWGLCGVDSTLAGRRLAIAARVENHAVLMGIPNAFTLEVTNETGHDLDVALVVEPFPGLIWDTSLPPTVNAPDGQTTALTREFTVDATSKVTDTHEASPSVKVRAIVDGEVTELLVGGKIRPAVAVSYHEGWFGVASGGSDEAVLDIVNHADETLSGEVEAYVEGVPEASVIVPFALARGEVSGVAVPVSVRTGAGATAARTQAFVDHGGARIAMPEHALPVVEDGARAVLIEENGGEVLHLLTDLLDVGVELRGGDLSFGRRALPDVRRPAFFQVGPPFGMNLDGSLRYSYRLDREGDAATLTLSADSLQMPGLRIDKAVRVRPGSREIEHWVTLTAIKPGKTRAGGRLATGGYGGNLSLNPHGEAARFIMPVARSLVDGEGQGRPTLIASDAQLNLLTETAVPQALEAWPETWTAVQGRARGDFAAWIWRREGVARAKVSHGMMRSLESESRELAAGESMEVAHVWFGLGYASVAEVRQRWAQLVGGCTLPWDEMRREPVPPVAARWADEAVVVAGTTVNREIVLTLPLRVELDGKLVLVVPEGWGGRLLDEERDIAQMLPPADAPGGPVEIRLQVELTVPDAVAAPVANARLTLRGGLEMGFDLPLWVVASDAGTVTVEEGAADGRPVVTVTSPSPKGSIGAPGGLSFEVMADAGGDLVHLRDAEGRDVLHDVFPRCEPRFFLTYYTGGVQPLFLTPRSPQFVYPPEPVTVRAVTDGRWRGAEATWVVREQEELRGQALSVVYLVTAGSDIVRIRTVQRNPTPRRIPALRGLMAFVHPDFMGDEGTVTVPGATQTWVHRPGPAGFVGPDDLRVPWAWFTAGERSLGVLGMSKGRTGQVAFSFGDFLGVIMHAQDDIQPGTPEQPSCAVAEFALVLNRPAREAEALLAALQAL